VNLTTRSGAVQRGVAVRMRHAVPRSLALSAVVLSLTIPAAPVSAGPPIDLPRLDIQYEYDPPLDSHGYWVGDPKGGEWRVVDSRLGPAGFLTLDLEVRPPAVSVPLESGPAVLFGRVGLEGGIGGDVGAGAEVPRTVAQVVAPCPEQTDCVYRGSITLPTDRLPGLAARYPEAGWSSAVISLTLVRTFAQGTWLQVLPLVDESDEQPYGTVGDPRHISSRMLALGASPIGPRDLWSRRDRPQLDRIERLRQSVDDPSTLPETQPLLIDIETAPCTPGWTIATATGDVLVDVTEAGRPAVPVRVEAPVGAEWLVSVPSIDRAQGTGDRPRTYGPFRSDGPMMVSGSVAGDPYLCEGVEPGSVTWRPVTDEEVANFAEGDAASPLDTYATLPARDLPAATTTKSVVPSARQALECDFKGRGVDSGPGIYGEGERGYADPGTAMRAFIREGSVIPQSGYRELARDETAVLYGYEHKGEVKVAVRVVAVRGAEDDWVADRLTGCRLVEYGRKADMGPDVWLWANRWDRTVQERIGPAHCDWQSVRFLYWAPPGTPDTLRATSLYVRDPKSVFRDQWTVPFLRSTSLPSDARYTGYRRDGKALWLAADERAMYAKDGDRVERWPRIPTGTGCA
jgi:hypothetical protein